jgi:ribonuclease J
VEILRHEGGTSIRVGEPVAAGHVFVDGKGVGDVEEVVLRDRRVLSATGMVICVTILGEDGTLVAGPDIISRGVLHEDANPDIVDRAVSVVEQALSKEPRWLDVGSCADTIRVALRRFFRRELDRRPLILPVVMSL